MKWEPFSFLNVVLSTLLCGILVVSCKGEDQSNFDKLALTELNATLKPPLQCTDVERLDERKDNSTNEEMYWIKYKAKVVAGEDLQVFTNRGWTGMDTFYVANNDTVFLKKIHDQIEFANNYNKNYGAGSQTPYKEIGKYKKGDSIKELIKGVYFVESNEGWRVRN